MGRYYHGDIEGKFWFAVQPSNDPEFFGMIERTDYIQYYVDDSQMKEIEAGLSACKMNLRGYLVKLDKFFKKHDSYSDEMLEEELKVSPVEARNLLRWYARYRLGKKIHKCVKEQGSCWIEAET